MLGIGVLVFVEMFLDGITEEKIILSREEGLQSSRKILGISSDCYNFFRKVVQEWCPVLYHQEKKVIAYLISKFCDICKWSMLIVSIIISPLRYR